jgi:MFS transporter, CP family, cyanate transporter
VFTALFAAQAFLAYGMLGWYPHILVSRGLGEATAGVMLGLMQLVGIGFCVFPLLMLLISRSGDTPADTTALSTLAQSLGYAVAAVGPFGLGLMNGLLGNWTAAMVVLLVVSAAQGVLSYRVSSPSARS